jgi:error-prone DNA polymerase
MDMLAEIGALNALEGTDGRGALWHSARAVRPVGTLLERLEDGGASPLAPTTPEERLRPDYRGAGVTTGPHPMAFQRAEIDALGCRARRTCQTRAAAVQSGLGLLITRISDAPQHCRGSWVGLF